jgi:hypothetical protein
MSKKSLRIQVEIPGWDSLDLNRLLGKMKENVFKQLKEQNRSVREAVVTKSCKNALSLAHSKKNNKSKFLVIYIPQNSVDESSNYSSHLVASVSVGSEENNKDGGGLSENIDAPVCSELIFNFVNTKGLVITANFSNLRNFFSCFLSGFSMPVDLNTFVNEICAYCFDSDDKFYVNVSETRRELCSQLSCFFRDAKKKARARNTTVIKILIESNNFVFNLKSVEPVHRTDEFLSNKFDSFASNSSSHCILLVREKDQICIQPRKGCLYMYISISFAFRALEQFDITNVVDVDELFFIIESYCQQRQLVLNIEKNIDNLKTCVLSTRIDINQLKFFTCIIELADQCLLPENDDNIDLNALLGPVYPTRGIKRNNQETALDSNDSELEANNNKQDELWQPKPSSSSKKIKRKIILIFKTTNCYANFFILRMNIALQIQLLKL